MLPLFASIAALLAGPLIYRIALRRPALQKGLDGVVIFAVVALVVLAIVPEVVEAGSVTLVGVVVLGLASPSVLEYSFHRFDLHRAENWTHLLTLLLGLFGLLLHATVEGAVMGQSATGRAAATLIPVAVVVHRLPVGLTIWWLLCPRLGPGAAIAVLSLVVLGTIGGFVFGAPIIDALSGRSALMFQAFVAGMLLHVVFYRQHVTPLEH